MTRLLSTVLFLIITITVLQAEDKKLILISDVDDTIKRTHVLGKFTGGLFLSNDFVGLNVLYKMLVCNKASSNDLQKRLCQIMVNTTFFENAPVYYLSGAPSILKYTGSLFVTKSQFPKGEFLNRPNLKISTKDFKIIQIENILNKVDSNREVDVVLIGDNGEKDVEVYDTIVKKFLKRNFKFHVYIHNVYATTGVFKEIGDKLGKEQIPFVTAMDLAMAFYANGWIEKQDLKAIDKIVMSTMILRPETIIPHWMKCHEFFREYNMPLIFDVSLHEDIREYFQELENRCYQNSVE